MVISFYVNVSFPKSNICHNYFKNRYISYDCILHKLIMIDITLSEEFSVNKGLFSCSVN